MGQLAHDALLGAPLAHTMGHPGQLEDDIHYSASRRSWSLPAWIDARPVALELVDVGSGRHG